MPYPFLPNPIVDPCGYSIESYREQDLSRIKQWRNEQMKVLRQRTKLSDADQLRYYRDVIAPSMSESRPAIVLVSFLAKGECIGYGGLTNIDWRVRRAEVSFLVATERTHDDDLYAQDFTAFLSVLCGLAFRTLALSRLFAETYDIRPRHIAVLEKSGFRLEGRLRKHIAVEGIATDALFHGLLLEDYDGR